MTIEDFLRLLLRNALILVVVTLLGAAAGYGLSYTRTPVYSASALGYVSASSQIDEEGNAVSQASGNMEFQYAKAQSYLPLFTTRAVGERIVEELGLDASPDAVAGGLEVVLDPNAPIITVTATAATPEQASEIADAAVRATAEEAKALESGGNEDSPVSVQLAPYQTALTPGAPVSPDREKYLLAGAAAGLLVALALAWLRDRNDTRIRTAEDITRSTDAPLLGTLPDDKDLSRGKDQLLPDPKGFGPREAIRKLRTNLRYVDVDAPPRSIVVTSSAPGEGKSTVSGNLARVMARAGQQTLLIDADLRRPVVADQFGVDGSVGLSQVLAGAVSLEDALQPSPTRSLTLLPAGQVPPNPSELLGSRRMHELIDELSRTYFVIIDAPPVLAVTDAQLLSRHVDGAIVVAVAGRTRTVGIAKSVDSIASVGSKVFGVVLNRVSSSRFKRLAYGDAEYGYGSYGGYSYGAAKSYADASIAADGPEVDVEAVGGPEPLRDPAPAQRPSATPQDTARKQDTALKQDTAQRPDATPASLPAPPQVSRPFPPAGEPSDGRPVSPPQEPVAGRPLAAGGLESSSRPTRRGRRAAPEKDTE